MFNLSIVTPSKKLVTDLEVEEMFVPAFRGELNILSGHAPLVTTLTTGILKYRIKGETKLHGVAISWGYCEITRNDVSVLAETAESAQDLDRERVHVALKESLTKMSEEMSIENLEKYRRKYERALMRSELIGLESDET